MDKKIYFGKIDFNKPWSEQDWEQFFQAQDAYRVSCQNVVIRKKPIPKIKFEGNDEVAAFEPVIREYGAGVESTVVDQLQGLPFRGDENPEDDYHPATDEDPHYWSEGAPLSTVLIYRDCCRFAICTSQEIDRHAKARGPEYRRTHSAEFESLRFHANWVAINVAQGHRIGYADDRIRGNIAKSRRAVKHADVCIGLISRIARRTRSMRLRRELFSFSVQLRNGLFSWIDELRSRFED
jgi:hypothetical protein